MKLMTLTNAKPHLKYIEIHKDVHAITYKTEEKEFK